MKINSYIKSARSHTVAIARTLFLVFALVLSTITPMFTANTSALTAEEYCVQYTNNAEYNACKSGTRGGDCADYEITHTMKVANICRQAENAKKSGQITDSPVTPPSSGGSGSTDAQVYRNVILNACAPYSSDTAAALWCLYGGLGQDGKEGKPKSVADCLTKPELQGSNRNQAACINGATAGKSYLQSQGGDDEGAQKTLENGNAVQDILDQTQNLSGLIDALHEVGPNADVDIGEQADNNYLSYVNGAGKQQAIKMWPCAGGVNCPAILWFNGGGWHFNDGTAAKIATGEGSASQPPAIGGGAQARGYTVFDVTYRLGSSSVYYALEDVLRGIQHIRNNAGMYNIDPNRIAIGGDSAGGSLSMRAGSTGKSGAKVMVGWSAPTNGYTAIFKSFQSFGVGVDHSTCIPTDLAGLTNLTDLLNGGSGDVAEYGQGLSSNDFSALGIGGEGGIDPLGLITQVLVGAQYAAETSQNVEAISKQIESASGSGGIMNSGLPANVMNLASKKFIECIDNFNTLSPALFASPDSPPGILAGFDNDGLIDPSQLYQMRDKLLGLGVRSEAVVIQGDPSDGTTAAPAGAGGNHLGYDPRFVCPTLNFLDEILQPDKPRGDCTKGGSFLSGPAVNSGGGGGGGGSGGGSGGGGSGGGSNSGGSGGGSTSSGGSNNSGGGGSSKPDCSMYVSDGRQDLSAQRKACEAGQPIPGTNNGTSGGGKFNPGVQIDTSTTSVSPSICGDRGGFVMGPDGKKVDAANQMNGNTQGQKIVCYGGEW